MERGVHAAATAKCNARSRFLFTSANSKNAFRHCCSIKARHSRYKFAMRREWSRRQHLQLFSSSFPYTSIEVLAVSLGLLASQHSNNSASILPQARSSVKDRHNKKCDEENRQKASGKECIGIAMPKPFPLQSLTS